MVVGGFFQKNLRACLFNDDLSNEPNFGPIHLAGHYLAISKVRVFITNRFRMLRV
jgi:hypothetical protein